MFIVYGDNKYTQIASDVDQVFNYAGLDFNGGEFFVEDGVVDRFTLEMKLQACPASIRWIICWNFYRFLPSGLMLLFIINLSMSA